MREGKRSPLWRLGRELLKYVNCVAWITIKLVLHAQVSWRHEVPLSRPATRSEPTGRVTSTKADIAEGPRAKPIRPAPPITTIFIANAYSSVTGRWSSHGCATRRDARLFPGASDRKPKRKNSQTARHPVWDSRALRRTAYTTAIITFASHEANAPILTPDIPAMIAAATMVLIATQTPQRRSALR